MRAYGWLFWTANVGYSVSAVAGGFLAGHGYGLLFWFDAAASVVAALVVWRLVPETRPPTRAAERARPLLPVLLRDRLTITLALVFVAHSAVFVQAFSTLPLVMAADGLGPATYGSVLALNGIVVVAAQPLAVRLFADSDRTLVLSGSILLTGLGLALGAVVQGVPGYAASVLVLTVGEIGVALMFGPTFADRAPNDLRGGYLGVAATAWGVGQHAWTHGRHRAARPGRTDRVVGGLRCDRHRRECLCGRGSR